MQDDIGSKNADDSTRSITNTPTANPFIRKLASLAPLTDLDATVLETVSADVQSVDPGTDLIREGDAPNGVYLVMEGVACRYKLRPNGARQIMAFLVPGDFCDLDVAFLKQMDHAIGTLSACKVVRIELGTILDLVQNHPSIAQALRIATLVDEATLREWLVNVGSRSSDERIAHLLCELQLRLQAAGQATGDSYQLPITTTDLADTTGLTNIHVNRTLSDLRERGLIERTGSTLRILDRARLEALAEFKPNYLHLGGRAVA